MSGLCEKNGPTWKHSLAALSSAAALGNSPACPQSARSAATKACRVRSWIFRHRLRLRAIYGPRPEPKAAPVATVEREREPAPLLHGLAPGEVGFVGTHFVLRPMGRRVA